MSLLAKAKAHSVNKGRVPIGKDELDLVRALIRKEITWSQASLAVAGGKPRGMQFYITFSRAVRELINKGELQLKNK